MSIFDFKKRFGQTININEVKGDFVNKINYYLFEPLRKEMGRSYSSYSKGKSIFDYICLGLSREPQEMVREAWNRELIIPSFKELTGNDFDLTLMVIELIYEYFKTHEYYGKERWIKNIDSAVELALDQLISVGVYWYDCKFYPQGAEELDEKLIKDPLDWLVDYPKVKSIYENALDNYSQSKHDPVKRKDTISNAQQALDELSRQFLNNNSSFDKNYNEIIKQIGLNQHWGHILNRYNELSKEFGRHPGRGKTFIPEESDTEAYLYLTGIILRLILKNLKKNNR